MYLNRIIWIWIVALLMVATTCDDSGDGQGDGGPNDGGADGNDTDTMTDNNGWDDDDDNDDNNDDQDSSDMSGCKGVDFLFVIDNSRSMKDEQENLINSFPGFIQAITDVIAVDDYHIMAVDSDAGFFPNNCNQKLGAGHIGQNTNGNCEIAGDNRYLVKEQQDLNDAFACIANVGTSGSGDEKMMNAMAQAVGPESAEGACNAGFIRDDAILVVTFITDEEDQCTGIFNDCKEPSEWKQALIDAKKGNEKAVVVLGVFGDNDLNNGICEEYDEDGNGAMPAPRLREFINAIAEDRRHYCSVCLPDYSDCFLEAVDTIDTTCDDLDVE